MTFESLSFAPCCDLCSVILCGDRELIEFSGGFSGVSIPLFPRQWGLWDTDSETRPTPEQPPV